MPPPYWRPAALSPETSPGAYTASAVTPENVGDVYLIVLSMRLVPLPVAVIRFFVSPA